MQDCAIIYKKEQFGFFERNINRKKTYNKTKNTFNKDGISFLSYNIPLSEYELDKKEKKIEKYIKFLKSEGIEKIVISDNLLLHKKLCEKLCAEFFIFNGFSVINQFIYEIIRKYILQKNKKPEESRVVLITNNPETAVFIFTRLCKSIKSLAIMTENEESFYNVSEYFLREYGFVIEFIKERGVENSIYIKTDSKILCFDCLDLSKAGNAEIIYHIKDKYSFIFKYFKIINQRVLEYLIYNHENTLSAQAIEKFKREKRVKPVKVIKND